MYIKRGFSLIEVLVFVTILSLFLITAASIITVSMRQNSLKVHMLKATHYNEQLLDWIKTEKETDWNAFVNWGDVAGKTYCFTDSAFSWSIATCDYTLDSVFKRYAILKTVGSPVSQVEVTIYTDWRDISTIQSTKLHTVFTIWEE